MQSDDDLNWGDHSLFIAADGLRATDAPWRLGDYSTQGPLTAAQVAELATTHSLDPSVLQELVKRMSYVLNPNANIHVVPTSLSKGRKRAAAHLSDADAQLTDMASRLEAVVDRLTRLTMDCDDGSPHSADYVQVLEQLERTHGAILDSKRALEWFVKRPELFLKLEALDKRNLHDRRRDEVLGVIFQAWVDAGRKVSFTTDPVTSKRGGAFVQFAQEVCAMLTDPPTQIASETIAKLISKKGKNYRPMARWLSVFYGSDE
jgi:hypothetical protein